MFIYSAFTDKVIDFSHFDEMMIGYFDREGHKCGFKEADFFEVRVAKLVETGSVPAWTPLFQSKSYRECSEVMLELIAHLKNGTTVAEINYKDPDMADYSPEVREYGEQI
ncbi:MAG: hypothetical protein J6M17_10915 [Ruminococcus sp.]|nr:hypothetical protein [Ruminococcus sp.]